MEQTTFISKRSPVSKENIKRKADYTAGSTTGDVLPSDEANSFTQVAPLMQTPIFNFAERKASTALLERGPTSFQGY